MTISAAVPRVLHELDRVVRGVAWLSGAIFLLTSFYITADVISRRFFGISSEATDEIGGYALAIGGMWALAYTLRTGGHVRIDVLLMHLPERLRHLLDYGALLLIGLFSSVVAFYSWRLSIDSFSIGATATSSLRTPLAVPQGLMALGFTIMAAEALILVLAGILESIASGRLTTPKVLQDWEG
jgi:TRAP-type C4-dicarboxylate transport system permease small subunit